MNSVGNEPGNEPGREPQYIASTSVFFSFGRPSRRIVCSSPSWLASFTVQGMNRDDMENFR